MLHMIRAPPTAVLVHTTVRKCNHHLVVYFNNKKCVYICEQSGRSLDEA